MSDTERLDWLLANGAEYKRPFTCNCGKRHDPTRHAVRTREELDEAMAREVSNGQG